MTIISITVPEIWSVRKRKKHLEILLLYTFNKNIDHMIDNS